jgi:hypothetical protein
MSTLTWADITRSERESARDRTACDCCGRHGARLNVGEYEDVKTGELFCFECGPHEDKATCPCRKKAV